MVRLGVSAAVEGFGDLGRCPDQDVGVPDGRDAEFRVGADFNPDIADMVLDRREARLLGQAEKRPLHRVALVADRDVREIRGEQIGLMVTLGWEPFRHTSVVPFDFALDDWVADRTVAPPPLLLSKLVYVR